MTLVLHYRLVSSGDLLFLFAVHLKTSHLACVGARQMVSVRSLQEAANFMVGLLGIRDCVFGGLPLYSLHQPD